jgi:hypothetical protein
MQRENADRHVLIGNSFPVSLISRSAVITPVELNEFRQEIRGCEIHSFWGHVNTLEAAEHFTGLVLAPTVSRPVLTLSDRNLPMLNAREFDVCWVLSPIYACSLRPEIGREVSIDQISGWRIKKLEWR